MNYELSRTTVPNRRTLKVCGLGSRGDQGCPNLEILSPPLVQMRTGFFSRQRMDPGWRGGVQASSYGMPGTPRWFYRRHGQLRPLCTIRFRMGWPKSSAETEPVTAGQGGPEGSFVATDVVHVSHWVRVIQNTPNSRLPDTEIRNI